MSNDVPGVKLTKFTLLPARPCDPGRGASSVASIVRRVARANDRSFSPPIRSLGRLARAMPPLLHT